MQQNGKCICLYNSPACYFIYNVYMENIARECISSILHVVVTLSILYFSVSLILNF